MCEWLDYARQCVRARLSRWRGLTREDREDAMQCALGACAKAMRRFDPAKGAVNTYIDRVCCRAVVSYLRSVRRRVERERPLERPLAERPVPTLPDIADAVLARIADADLRRLAEMRLAGATMGACMEALGVSRRGYEAMMARLRQAIQGEE